MNAGIQEKHLARIKADRGIGKSIDSIVVPGRKLIGVWLAGKANRRQVTGLARIEFPPELTLRRMTNAIKRDLYRVQEFTAFFGKRSKVAVHRGDVSQVTADFTNLIAIPMTLTRLCDLFFDGRYIRPVREREPLRLGRSPLIAEVPRLILEQKSRRWAQPTALKLFSHEQ